jgi:hypothetical protein
MGPIGNSETSVSNYLIPRNNPENGKIEFNHGGSLRFRTKRASAREMRSNVEKYVKITSWSKIVEEKAVTKK